MKITQAATVQRSGDVVVTAVLRQKITVTGKNFKDEPVSRVKQEPMLSVSLSDGTPINSRPMTESEYDVLNALIAADIKDVPVTETEKEIIIDDTSVDIGAIL